MEFIIKAVIVIIFLGAMIGSYVGIAIYLKRRFETVVFWLWIIVFGIPTSIPIAGIVIVVIEWVIVILCIPIAMLFR